MIIVERDLLRHHTFLFYDKTASDRTNFAK